MRTPLSTTITRRVQSSEFPRPARTDRGARCGLSRRSVARDASAATVARDGSTPRRRGSQLTCPAQPLRPPSASPLLLKSRPELHSRHDSTVQVKANWQASRDPWMYGIQEVVVAAY